MAEYETSPHWIKKSSDWENTETGYGVGCPPYNWKMVLIPAEVAGSQSPLQRALKLENGEPLLFYKLEDAMMVADLVAKARKEDHKERENWDQFKK